QLLFPPVLDTGGGGTRDVSLALSHGCYPHRLRGNSRARVGRAWPGPAAAGCSRRRAIGPLPWRSPRSTAAPSTAGPGLPVGLLSARPSTGAGPDAPLPSPPPLRALRSLSGLPSSLPHSPPRPRTRRPAL